MRGKLIPALALLLCLIAIDAARADEIRLKDGTKIIGTIVGFENDSFRVETSYGFALIQKDKVADISILAGKKESELDSRRSSRGREGACCLRERLVGSQCARADARPTQQRLLRQCCREG
jgi:hypothetical protein